MTRLALASLLVAFALASVTAAKVHAAPNSAAPVKPAGMRLAPPVACTSKNRMDIFVDEDKILWECTCEILIKINICRWQVIGGVDASRIRRKIELHLLPPRFYYSARWHYIRTLR